MTEIAASFAPPVDKELVKFCYYVSNLGDIFSCLLEVVSSLRNEGDLDPCDCEYDIQVSLAIQTLGYYIQDRDWYFLEIWPNHTQV